MRTVGREFLARRRPVSRRPARPEASARVFSQEEDRGGGRPESEMSRGDRFFSIVDRCSGATVQAQPRSFPTFPLHRPSAKLLVSPSLSFIRTLFPSLSHTQTHARAYTFSPSLSFSPFLTFFLSSVLSLPLSLSRALSLVSFSVRSPSPTLKRIMRRCLERVKTLLGRRI